MVARTRSTRRRAAPTQDPVAAPLDTIALFAEKMRAQYVRDRALEAVVQYRDAGQLRQAKAELARAERLHTRIEAIERQFATHRSDDR